MNPTPEECCGSEKPNNIWFFPRLALPLASREGRLHLPYNKVRANAGVARTNNRDKNQN